MSPVVAVANLRAASPVIVAAVQSLASNGVATVDAKVLAAASSSTSARAPIAVMAVANPAVVASLVAAVKSPAVATVDAATVAAEAASAKLVRS